VGPSHAEFAGDSLAPVTVTTVAVEEAGRRSDGGAN
jgi:hypothetical protein